jgi:hypothetical protein
VENPAHVQKTCRAAGGGAEGQGPNTNKKGYKPKPEKSANKGKKQSLLFISSSALSENRNTKADTWIIDSGASDHYANNMNMFEKIAKLNTPIDISVANEQVEQATHVGSFKIFTNVDNKPHKVA